MVLALSWMLLPTPPRVGLIPKSRHCEMFALFTYGEWFSDIERRRPLTPPPPVQASEETSRRLR